MTNTTRKSLPTIQKEDHELLIARIHKRKENGSANTYSLPELSLRHVRWKNNGCQ